MRRLRLLFTVAHQPTPPRLAVKAAGTRPREFPLYPEQSSFHWKIGSTAQLTFSLTRLSKFSRYCSALSANPISYSKKMELSLISACHLRAGPGEEKQ